MNRARKIEAKELTNRELRKKQRATADTDAKRWTVKLLFDEFLSSRPNLKGSNFDRYCFTNHLSGLEGKTPNELTLFDLKKLRHRLEKQGHKPASVRLVLELVRRISNFGEKKGFNPRLPFTIDMPRVDNKVSENLTPTQLKRLLLVMDEFEAIGGVEATFARMMKLALFSGMRRMDVFNL